MSTSELVSDLGVAVNAVSFAEGEPVQALESLCMRCGENGTTRILLTKIPHFREIVLMAFECPHCNERNNEVQFAGQLQPHGCKYTLKVPARDIKVLNRQVVKSDSGTIKIPELDFEVPPEAQRGSLSSVEGVLTRAADELQALQEDRWKVDPKTAQALDSFINKLRTYVTGEQAFTFILDDPSGNSFIENPHAPTSDPILSLMYYNRTPEEQTALGFLAETNTEGFSQPNDSGSQQVCVPNEEANHGNHVSETQEQKYRYNPAGTTRLPHGSVGAGRAHQAIAEGNIEAVAAALFKYSTPEEVMVFPGTCGACSTACETRMFVTNIPYFKEVIVMASSCNQCGFRNSELKPGGSIPEKGKKISVQIISKQDLSRDVIKSDSAMVAIPELELELAPGTLGGLVTTVEGLLRNVSDSLHRVHGFGLGDSADNWHRKEWQDFDSRLHKLLDVEEPWTLILDDALANSFVAPATDSFEDDSQLTMEEYTRSWEQDEELGIHDMDTGDASAT